MFETIGSLEASAVRQPQTVSMPLPPTSFYATAWKLSTWTLAARVHCSRATIYRYAGGKTQIRDAVLLRLAARIVDSVRRAVKDLSGAERVVKASTVALEHIRSDPMRQMMMGLSAGRDLTELPTSPVLGRLAADLTGITDDDPQAAQWIVRVVMSLAVWPVGDSRTEHEIVQRFVAPLFD